MQAHRRKKPNERGFTLLEVMIALAILAMSLTVLSQSDVISVRAVSRAKAMTIATHLARAMMVDVEDKLFDKGFSDFEEEKKGDFRDQGFKHFRYVLKVDKIELPENLNADSIGDAVGNSSGGGAGGGGAGGGGGGGITGGIAKAGARMMGAQFQMIRNLLEQSIRRVTVRVLWSEGKLERYVSVTGYFTDPRKIDALGTVAGLAAQAGAKKGTGTTTPRTGTQPRSPLPGARR